MTKESAELVLERRRQVEARTGLTRSGIYAAMAAGLFPKPVTIAERSVAWLSSEVDDWIKQRIAARGSFK